MPRPHGKPLRRPSRCFLLCLLLLPLLGGCSALVSSAADGFADSLTVAILDSPDPETVEAAIPAYLVLLDGLVARSPDDPGMLRASATLHGAFGSNFVDDRERARRLQARALELALRAACAESRRACGLREEEHEAFETWLARQDDAQTLYVLGATWAGYVQTHSDDWNAVAELARVRAIFERILALDETVEDGGAHLYLGVLDTLLPPAMGGRPEAGREHFERAIALSDGRHLTAKVLLAEEYARLVFDRELHDALLREVLSADPEAPSLTLANVLAQRRARELLASADEYF